MWNDDDRQTFSAERKFRAKSFASFFSSSFLRHSKENSRPRNSARTRRTENPKTKMRTTSQTRRVRFRLLSRFFRTKIPIELLETKRFLCRRHNDSIFSSKRPDRRTNLNRTTVRTSERRKSFRLDLSTQFSLRESKDFSISNICSTKKIDELR